jgi:hypothetical protein
MPYLLAVHAPVHAVQGTPSKLRVLKNLHHNSTTQQSEGIKKDCSLTGDVEIVDMPIFREKATSVCLLSWLSMLLSMLESMYQRLEKAAHQK